MSDPARKVEITYTEVAAPWHGLCDMCGHQTRSGQILYDRVVVINDEPTRSDVVCISCYVILTSAEGGK